MNRFSVYDALLKRHKKIISKLRNYDRLELEYNISVIITTTYVVCLNFIQKWWDLESKGHSVKLTDGSKLSTKC